MAYESFDNINQHELQAVIEAEINLFENTRSTNTYTNMEAPTFQEQFQPNFLQQQQQQFQPNFLQQQQQQFQPNSLEQASTPTLPSPLQGHSIEKKKQTRYSAEFNLNIHLNLSIIALLK